MRPEVAARALEAGAVQANAVYDVVADVVHELRLRVEAALHAGIPSDCLIVDPGLGFAKQADHHWQSAGPSTGGRRARPIGSRGRGAEVLSRASVGRPGDG